MNFSETCLLIVVILFVIAILWNTVLRWIFGLDFKYNLTEKQQEETRVLQICIHSDLVISQCEMLYGGVNSSYGEKLN